MKTFTDRLIDAIKAKKSVLCVGLDPQIEHLPEYLKAKHRKANKDGFAATAECIFEFNTIVIEAVCQYAAAVKPQAAFYEQYGHYGVEALEKTIAYARDKGLPVILDAKRGDGGDTARAYASAYVGRIKTITEEVASAPLGVDALTVHAWIGESCIRQFTSAMKESGTGIFVVTKTSFDPNSVIENIVAANGSPVWVQQARYISDWARGTEGENGYQNLGVVAGATYPGDAVTMRSLLPRAWFLVPGYGRQGGGAMGAVAGANEDGFGIIVNSSRGIIAAHCQGPLAAKNSKDGKGFEKIVKKAAELARQELNDALLQAGKGKPWIG